MQSDRFISLLVAHLRNDTSYIQWQMNPSGIGLPIPTHLQVLPIRQQPTNSITPSHMVFLDPTVLRRSVDICPGKPVIIHPASAQEPCCASFKIDKLTLSDLAPPTNCGHRFNNRLNQRRADPAAER